MEPNNGRILAAEADTDPNALGQLWAFIIFPMIGSAVGVLLYRFINDAD